MLNVSWHNFSLSQLQDVSRLVDVVRQSIVFDNLEGVERCLAVLQADHEAVVLRIKNRFDSAYNAEASGCEFAWSSFSPWFVSQFSGE